MPSIALPVSLRGQLFSATRAFSPTSLFASDESGIWLDPSDLTTMFQDLAGTTPVTAPDNTVGLMLDKSKGLALGSELRALGSISTAGAPAFVATYSTVTGAGTSYRTDVSNTSGVLIDVPDTDGLTLLIDLEVSTGTVQIRTDGPLGAVLATISVGRTTLRLSNPTANTICLCSGTNGAGNTFTLHSIRELAGNHATQATLAARPIYHVAANGDKVLENDGIDDALNVTFPNLGTNCTVCYVTQSEVRLDEAVTLNGSYTLPNVDILGFVAIDRALTKLEKIQLIYYMASKAQGVTYGAGIDDLDLIALNAVDLFVYDTSNDSDGGAWRTGALAQASSWFNETLNTATRGARREFPAVAVIVAEAAKVTIYDGDDPSLPMWKIYNAATSYTPFLGYGTGGSLSAVAAINGTVSVTSKSVAENAGVNGLFLLNFPADTGRKINAVHNRLWPYGIAVSQAPTTNVWLSVPSIGPLLVNNTVNDVAMTVLPGAPIDPATGLPVPTIAVATAGGVSVIRDDGTIGSLADAKGPKHLTFDSNTFNVIYTQSVFNINTSAVLYPNYTTAIALLTNIAPTQTTRTWANASIGEHLMFDNQLVIGGPINNGGTYALLQRTLLDGTSSLAHVYTTSTYTTGWMTGDIKGAFLSDTDDTDLVGSTPLDDDFTGYADETAFLAAGYSYAGTAPTFNATTNTIDFNAASGSVFFDGAMSVSDGTSLYVSVTTTGQTAGNLNLQNNFVSTGQINGGGISTDGTYEYLITKNGTLCFTSDPTYDGSIVSITVKLADADRSVNNNGLIVNGTVTRSPVATGADLVAYSGFSASNYLEQPYNSALDFGTGNFCVMGWAKATDANGTVFDRERIGRTTEPRFVIKLDASGNLAAYGVASSLIGSGTLVSSTWRFISAVRTSGVLRLYVDGVLYASGAFTDSVTDTAAVTRIGNQIVFNNPWVGSLALLRISATAPTAAQILKTYEDELPLFQTNAQSTLYGTSNAVTALAYDPDTEMLHVGTSSGRSVFRGLERVSHRAKSVSTSISAVGGLVIDK